MMQQTEIRETIVNSLPSDDGRSRILIIARTSEDGSTELSLKQESWSSDIGWFEQSQIPLSSDQLNMLKATLTSGAIESHRPEPSSARATVALRLVS